MLQELLPFKTYFADVPGTLLAGQDYEADLKKAQSCWSYLRTMFNVLDAWPLLVFQLLLQELFPFKTYFADAPGTLFAGLDYEADLEKARGCWRHLRTMFQELEECRAFELLKARIS